jgi:hypothetical protein
LLGVLVRKIVWSADVGLVASERTPGAGIIRAYLNDIYAGFAGLGPIGVGVYHRKCHTGNSLLHHTFYAFATGVSNANDLNTRRFLVQEISSSTPVFPRLIAASVGYKVSNRHPVSFAKLFSETVPWFHRLHPLALDAPFQLRFRYSSNRAIRATDHEVPTGPF